MIRTHPGDRNWVEYFLRADAWVDPSGEVNTRYPGALSTGRWNYRDNPWHGLGESEHRAKLAYWDNRPPGRERTRRGKM